MVLLASLFFGSMFIWSNNRKNLTIKKSVFLRNFICVFLRIFTLLIFGKL